MLRLDVEDLGKLLCVKNGARNVNLQVELVPSDRDRGTLEAGGKRVAVKL